jgi:FMN phosphatase YigB (HAD superfamily)
MAHIGDLRRTDVGGARAVGWTAVRYRGLNDDAPGDDDHPDASVVIDHHDELIEALGLG